MRAVRSLPGGECFGFKFCSRVCSQDFSVWNGRGAAGLGSVLLANRAGPRGGAALALLPPAPALNSPGFLPMEL